MKASAVLGMLVAGLVAVLLAASTGKTISGEGNKNFFS